MPVSQGWELTSNGFVAIFSHSKMEVGSNFHGFHNKITYDSEATWFNHGCGGQDFKRIFCLSKSSPFIK